MTSQELTLFEALALLDIQESQDPNGIAIVVNLDKISAGIVECEGECLVKELWSTSHDESTDFMSELLGRVLLGESSQAAASVTKEQYSGWIQSFKSYYRSKGTRDYDISLTDGTTLSCKKVVSEFESIFSEKARKMLAQVSDYVNEHNISYTRVVVCGELSGFFPAEYEVLSVFYPMPLSTVLPGYSSMGGSISQLEQKARELFLQSSKSHKVLPHTILLQLVSSTGSTELLTLAEQGTPFEKLSESNYSEKIFTFPNDPWTLIANNRVYSVKAPASTFSRGAVAGLVQLKLGISDEKPVLCLKTSFGEGQIELDKEIYGGNSNE